MFKVSNEDTRTTKTTERRSGVFIVHSNMFHTFLMFSLLTLNRLCLLGKNKLIPEMIW